MLPVPVVVGKALLSDRSIRIKNTECKTGHLPSGRWPVCVWNAVHSRLMGTFRKNHIPMKTFSYLLLLFFMMSFAFLSCNQPDNMKEADAALMDTVITEVRDTVITFYPETYEEVLQVVTSYDTVITPRKPDTE